MSHHYSGPDFGFPRGDARLDFTDLYAFPKPGDPRKSILIMNVHPSAFVNPPGPTTTEPFAPEWLYEFKIVTDGDAVADIAYRRLTDDAGDAFLAILTNGKVTEDGVEAQNDLLAEFPYLGPPRSVPSPRRTSCVTGVDLAVDGGRHELNRRD
jgi:hypothetical protein